MTNSEKPFDETTQNENGSSRKKWVIPAIAIAVVLGLAALWFGKGIVSPADSAAPSAVTEMTDSTVDSQLKGISGPVYFQFYDPESVDSQTQLMILDSIADEYAGKVKFFRVNVIKERVAERYFRDQLTKLSKTDPGLTYLPSGIHLILTYTTDGHVALVSWTNEVKSQDGLKQYINGGLALSEEFQAKYLASKKPNNPVAGRPTP